MLEIVQKCREAKSSEVKSQKWSEKLSNVKCSEVNEAKWSEVQYSEGVGEQDFMEKVYRSSKWWEVKDWGEAWVS